MIWIIITNQKDINLTKYINASEYTAEEFYDTVNKYSINYKVNIKRIVWWTIKLKNI